MMQKLMFFILCFLSISMTTVVVAQPNFTKHVIDNNFDPAGNFIIDIDGDGDMDLVAASYDDGDMAWFENDGEQNFNKHIIAGGFNGAYAVSAIDLDQDGDIDILGGSSFYDKDLKWWENDGNQNFTAHLISDVTIKVYSIQPIDFDQDGDLDVVTAGEANPNITWWENDNMSFTRRIVKNNLNLTQDAYASDINGDGNIDVVGVSFGDDKISWWENTDNVNDQSFTENNVVQNYDKASDVFVCDLDGDNDMDLITSSYEGSSSNNIRWYENTNGNGNFSKRNIATFDHAVDATAADIDNDGDIDILGCNEDGKVKLWENDGNQSFTGHLIGDYGSDYLFENHVNVADIDGDGDIDILISAGDALFWLENDVADAVLSFDGTDDYLTLGNISELDVVTQLTATGWFYFDGLSQKARLIAKQDKVNIGTGWSIALGDDNTGGADDISLSYRINDAMIGDVYTDGLGLVTGQWYHIAVVFDGLQIISSDKVTIYVNGKKQDVYFNGTPLLMVPLPINNHDVVLGARSNGNGHFFHGSMDEISLWTTALSQYSIKELMHKTISNTTADLEVYHRFDGVDGIVTFADFSGNDHTGTWMGASGGANLSSYLGTETQPFTNSNIQNVRGLWSTVGTAKTMLSDGMRIKASVALTDTSRAIWGHDGAGSSVVSDDLTTSAATNRFLQTWKVEEVEGLTNMIFEFDLSSISDVSVVADSVSNYVLLYRSDVFSDFSDVATGSSISKSDRITFAGIALQDGYYTIGTTSSVNSPLAPAQQATARIISNTSDIENGAELNLKTNTTMNDSRLNVSNYKIVPNPANDFITIEKATSDEIVQIFNISGQLVNSFQHQSPTNKYSISQLPNGTYFVKIGATVKKLVIAR